MPGSINNRYGLGETFQVVQRAKVAKDTFTGHTDASGLPEADSVRGLLQDVLQGNICSQRRGSLLSPLLFQIMER
ncbi:MAG TPA: hypothetical protein DIT97_28740 [Gimesia maris]|uniref:Uncharacterized protein n=1 Tax=Gimesia maris TaxID=122 RepID=A0A3D3RFK1_9PLAN|nr:hypothetical protein [Gimesia maris]